MAYDKAVAVRDELATELAALYPQLAEKLAALLVRIVESDIEIARVNGALPSGGNRLLSAELVARGVPPVVDGVEVVRLTYGLRLPSWGPRARQLWPPLG